MRRTFAVTAVIAVIASVLMSSPLAAQDTAEPVETAPIDAPAAEVERMQALEQRISDLEARLAAQPPEAEADADAEAEPDAEPEPDAPSFRIGAWAEAYYGFNFNQPSNGITDLRGFDSRHNSFNLSNVALDTQWDWEGVHGRITLQWGQTATTSYLPEPSGAAPGSGIGAQGPGLWQFVQQANVGYVVPVGSGLDVQAGLFLSPIGPEGINVKDNWFYSRSNLFFGLPFYHTGLRLSYALTDQLTAVVWLVNGWNTVLDNNSEKSIAGQLTLAIPDVLSASLIYFAGVERPEGAPERSATGTAPWRHTFDLNATITPTEWLGIQGQIAGGLEPNAFGTDAFFAGALAVRVAPVEWLALSARGDFFWQRTPVGGSSIFWPAEWVSSATGSVELRPHANVSFRLEYRHDHARSDAYFQGAVATDMTSGAFIRNAASQDTVTLGATVFFDHAP